MTMGSCRAICFLAACCWCIAGMSHPLSWRGNYLWHILFPAWNVDVFQTLRQWQTVNLTRSWLPGGFRRSGCKQILNSTHCKAPNNLIYIMSMQKWLSGFSKCDQICFLCCAEGVIYTRKVCAVLSSPPVVYCAWFSPHCIGMKNKHTSLNRHTVHPIGQKKKKSRMQVQKATLIWLKWMKSQWSPRDEVTVFMWPAFGETNVLNPLRWQQHSWGLLSSFQRLSSPHPSSCHGVLMWNEEYWFVSILSGTDVLGAAPRVLSCAVRCQRVIYSLYRAITKGYYSVRP